MAILTSDKNPKSSCVGKAIASLLLVYLLLLLPSAQAAADTDAVVSFLGPTGTYTEQAAERLFPQGAVFQPRETVADAVSDVLEKRADFAVMPQENTIGGPVYDYLDELLSHEAQLPVRQCDYPQAVMSGTKI